MAGPIDREISPLEILGAVYPAAPLNIMCSSAFQKGVFDIRWTLPDHLHENSSFTILGVKIYRSFDSQFGPWFRLNNSPIGAMFYRDMTKLKLQLQENVSNKFTCRGNLDAGGKWVFRTSKKPISIAPSLGSANLTNLNVQVTVNGVAAFVESIQPATGEVELRRSPTFDVASQIQTPPVLPTSDNDVVLATYKYVENQVYTDLGQRIFYAVTTVGIDSTGTLVETPFDRAALTNNFEIEKLDYIWKEAIRREKWILDQGGERVKVFIRRAVGVRCGCVSDLHKQPTSDCLGCYGSGILGGYDGPFDISIAPDDGDKSVKQSNLGRSLSHTYDTWTLPTPLLSQRDFIVKLNGDRYGIGPVRMPSNRGMQLLQFFPISHLDELDIRYKVPVIDTLQMVFPETRYPIAGQGKSTPMMTDTPGIPAERQIRAGTVTGGNHNK